MRIRGYLLWLISVAAVQAQQEPPFCQILDRYETPPWTVQGGYISSASIKGGDDVGVFAVRGGGGMAFVRTDFGDFDLTGHYEFNVLTDDGNIGLPNQYGKAFLGLSYIRRGLDGFSWKLDAEPGLYSDFSDLSGDDLAVPFTVSVIQAYNEHLSGLAGLAVFPGFERVFDPRIGLRWSPWSTLTFDVMYPQSRVLFNPADGWDVAAGVRFDRTSQYALDDGDEREALLLQDLRWTLSLSHPLADALRMTWEVGVIQDRRVEFARGGPDRDWDSAQYFSVGIGAEL